MRQRFGVRLLLTLVIILSGYFHFHALNWNDAGFPHPDERAVVSQTYDMLTRDDYRPTIHTWGHFGYYSTLFFYKGYIYLQYFLNAIQLPETGRLSPQYGRAVPQFRELVYTGHIVPIGIAGVLLLCLGYIILCRILRHRLPAVLLLLITLALAVFLYPRVKLAMLAPVQPNYDDVTLAGRFLSAFFCMLCVPILYDIGKRLYCTRVGVLAATFFAFTVLGIQLGHFFAADMPQAFCILLVIWAASALVTASPNPTALVETPSDPNRSDRLNGLTLSAPLKYLLRVNHSISWSTLLLYPAMGIAIGMALSSKFSSAPILALPFVAHFLFLQRTRAARQFMPHFFFVLCCVMALGAWFYFQPYAWEQSYTPYINAVRRSNLTDKWLNILFSAEFARQIHEQSQMVKLRAGGPWTQQFANTIPYVTIGMQTIRWSFGWPLGLVCVGGFLFALLRNFFRPRGNDLLLLSWTAVYLIITGSFKATFPRYTVAAIPLLTLFGAELCLGDWHQTLNPRFWGRLLLYLWLRLRSIVAAIAVLSAILYSFAYMQVYDRMHTWSYASLWIYKNIPDKKLDASQTLILHEEWDDEIPVGMPYHSQRYGSVKMAPYHDDGESKVRTIAGQLERADWICLPTTRLYGTTMTVPNKYRMTVKYYKALFAGELGYTLRKTVTRPATLWGWEFNDLLADESHRVYDHPKCVIFEKTTPLTANEYYGRILSLSPEIEALTRKDIMLWTESPREQLLNLVREPYPDDGVFTFDEVQEILERPSFRSRFQDDRLEKMLSRANKLATVPCLPVEDVSRTIAAGGISNAQQLASLRKEIASMPVSLGISIARLKSLLKSHSGLGANEQNDVLNYFRSYLRHSVVDRAVVLNKIDRINLTDGSVPPLTQQDVRASERQAPEKIARITQCRDGWWYELWQVIKWLAILDLLALAILPLACSMFRSMPDFGYPLARTLGLVVGTYIVWIAVNLNIGYFTVMLCWLSLLALAAACWLFVTKEHLLQLLRERFSLILVTELLFLSTFVFFLVIRAFNPEIFWGEKTMDFSFYNAVVRGSTFPPYEPWFSGALLNYYYYGDILIGYVTKLTATPTALGFNLSMATIPALTVLCAFSLVYNLTKRIRWGVLGALFVGYIGNFDPVYQLAVKGSLENSFNEVLKGELLRQHGFLTGFWLSSVELLRTSALSLPATIKAILSGALFFQPSHGRMWDSFWASSRALGEGMINEYPVWSWLFADLHAHVLVMPVSLLVLSFIYLAYRSRKTLFEDHLILGALFFAVTIGSQLASNIWDFISYMGLFGLALTVRSMVQPKNTLPFLETPSCVVQGGDTSESVTFREQVKAPSFIPILSLIGFVAVWTYFWPEICELHPYWLGCVNMRAVGFIIALTVVVLSVIRGLVLDTSAQIANSLWQFLRESAVPLIIVVGLSGLLFIHFHANLQTDNATFKFNNDGYINFWNAIRHFGFFIALTIVWVFMSYYAAFTRRTVNKDSSLPSPIVPLVLGVVACALFAREIRLAGFWLPAHGIVIYMMLLPALLSTMFLWRGCPTKLFISTLLFAGWTIATISELIVIIDRMNTVFKFYHHTWIFVAIGCAGAVGVIRTEWMGRVFEKPKGNVLWEIHTRIIRALFSLAFLFALFLTLICTYRAVHGTVTRNLKKSDKPTLNGVNFLKHNTQEAELFEAVDWLNRNVAGPQVIAEGFTNQGYDESTIACKYTGLPTLLGWPHHTKQRGRTHPELSEREQDLRLLYTTDDDSLSEEICEKYNIKYIFLGHIERRLYQDTEKRLTERANLEAVFSSQTGAYVVFRVIDAS